MLGECPNAPNWYNEKTMDISFSDEAKAVEDRLFADADLRPYNKLWDVLEQILSDPEQAKHAPWTNYVSSRRLWGTKVPGTNYTVFWRVDPGAVIVVLLVEDQGL